jgi:hypothetical protein
MLGGTVMTRFVKPAIYGTSYHLDHRDMQRIAEKIESEIEEC